MTPIAALAHLLMDLFTTPSELSGHLVTGPDGERLATALPASAGLQQLATEAALALRARGLANAAFFARLRGDYPRRKADIDRVAALWARAPGPEPAADPLPDTAVNLDRISQWADVLSRSRSRRHELFLLYGPPKQSLGDFTTRIHRHLNEECVRGHQVYVVSADHDGEARPSLPGIWEQRFAAALSPDGLRAVRALQAAAEHEPVFALVGKLPFRSGITPEDELDALCAWLDEPLARVVAYAQPAHPLRLYVAIEEAPGGPWTDRLAAALDAAARAIDGRFVRPGAVCFPSWHEVDLYVQGLNLETNPDWIAKLETRHAACEAEGGHFRDFCHELDLMLRQLPPKKKRRP